MLRKRERERNSGAEAHKKSMLDTFHGHESVSGQIFVKIVTKK